MKADAPERIWIDPITDLPKLSGHIDKDSIEYIRTDAVINKACEWLKNFNDFHNIMRYSDCCEVPLDQLIEDFKNYMTEEKV